MRPLNEWDETDLGKLIADQVQEGLQLDYKRSDALARSNACTAELSKDVSAFANSAGGRIVYGIMEENHLPSSLDSGSDPAVISREWIEQVINSRIQPRVAGIKIKPIPLASGGTAYVIEIPQATTFAPHQADNHRYYRRFNFQSVPMEDYEIKDAMRRSTVGDPFVRFSWSEGSSGEGDAPTARLRVYAGNRASEPIMYALVRIIIDSRLIPEDVTFSDWTIRRDLYAATGEGPPIQVVMLTRNVMPNNHMPFFKETEWLMADATVPVPPSATYVFSYEFTAPGIDQRLGGLFHIDGYEITPLAPELAELLHAGLSPT